MNQNFIKMKKLFYVLLTAIITISAVFTACTKENNLVTETVTGCSGKVYKTVKIGNQWWMAENLNETQYDTQSERASINLSKSSSSTYTPYYTNSTIDKGGKLYNWAATVALTDGQSNSGSFSGKRQGICPNGWHVPTDVEFTVLENYLGGSSVAGKKMKSTTDWNPNNGTNKSGFSALPVGRADGSNVDLVGFSATFWTASVATNGYGNHLSLVRILHSDDGEENRQNHGKSNGYSVRCVKD